MRNLILTIWCWFTSLTAHSYGHHYITAMPQDWYEGHWFSGPGWYWADECQLLVGPYDSEQAAEDALQYYVRYEL